MKAKLLKKIRKRYDIKFKTELNKVGIAPIYLVEVIDNVDNITRL